MKIVKKPNALNLNGEIWDLRGGPIYWVYDEKTNIQHLIRRFHVKTLCHLAANKEDKLSRVKTGEQHGERCTRCVREAQRNAYNG